MLNLSKACVTHFVLSSVNIIILFLEHEHDHDHDSCHDISWPWSWPILWPWLWTWPRPITWPWTWARPDCDNNHIHDHDNDYYHGHPQDQQHNRDRDNDPVHDYNPAYLPLNMCAEWEKGQPMVWAETMTMTITLHTCPWICVLSGRRGSPWSGLRPWPWHPLAGPAAGHPQLPSHAGICDLPDKVILP